jgi:hypothetical protein
VLLVTRIYPLRRTAAAAGVLVPTMIVVVPAVPVVAIVVMRALPLFTPRLFRTEPLLLALLTGKAQLLALPRTLALQLQPLAFALEAPLLGRALIVARVISRVVAAHLSRTTGIVRTLLPAPRVVLHIAGLRAIQNAGAGRRGPLCRRAVGLRRLA